MSLYSVYLFPPIDYILFSSLWLVHKMAAEEEQEVASGSGDENKEQQAQRRQTSDRGKEKAHDNGSKG